MTLDPKEDTAEERQRFSDEVESIMDSFLDGLSAEIYKQCEVNPKEYELVEVSLSRFLADHVELDASQYLAESIRPLGDSCIAMKANKSHAILSLENLLERAIVDNINSAGVYQITGTV